MTSTELGEILKNMYFNAPKGNSVIMILLFGIKHAMYLEKSSTSLKEILKLAGINESYYSEISKGIMLADYVDIIKNPING